MNNKMKYLLRFNESAQDGMITDSEFETIRDCFMEYSDNGECSKVTRRNQSVQFTFQIPETQDVHKRYEWLENLLVKISNDVKRCEGFGFDCVFYLEELPVNLDRHNKHYNEFTIDVGHKGIRDSRRKDYQDHDNRVPGKKPLGLKPMHHAGAWNFATMMKHQTKAGEIGKPTSMFKRFFGF